MPSINRGVPFMMITKNKSLPVARAMLNLAEVVRHKLVVLEEAARKLETAQAGKR